MMIQINALPAFNDNYIWLLKDTTRQLCAVVDPGDAAPVEQWLATHPQWQLSSILVTHHHHDHVGGVARLKAATGAHVYGPAAENIPARDTALQGGESIEVLGLSFAVLAVPGHTLGHVAYYQAEQNLLFCGDTLFAGGCGRLFEGTPLQMHTSLSTLAALPECTQVYCTHEYTLSNLRFAHAAEPDNAVLTQRLHDVIDAREAGRITLPSSIALERATNPFLRTQSPTLQQVAKQRSGLAALTDDQVFAELRRWKDTF